MGLRHLLTLMLLPPGVNFLLLLLSVLMWPVRRALAIMLAVLSFLMLFVVSIPVVKTELMAGLEVYPPVSPEMIRRLDTDKAAIVILSGGIERTFREYDELIPSSSSMRRTWYGAKLHRESGLPILVSGGDVIGSGMSEAQAMANQLAVMGITAQWVEGLSLNTWQNAVNTAEYLVRYKVDTVILVTEAWHMKRALYSFQDQNLTVFPAPTGFLSGENADRGWLPKAEALSQSAVAIKEYLGLLAYQAGFQSPKK